MSLHIYSNEELLAKGLAEWIGGNINLVLRSQDRYSLVLSGGSTPVVLYQLLASEYKNKVDWGRVDFFWGDERYVPFDDKRNNGKMAFETLLYPLNIPEKNIYRIQTSLPPEDAASDYEKILKGYLKSSDHTFDFTLLGMGGDGHTLSVFPNSPLLDNEMDWVKNVLNTKENLQRITLLPSLVNQSRNIAFMVKGADKAATLKEVIRGQYNPALYPSQLIKAEKGNLLWFTDEAAAEQLVKF